MPSRPRPGLQPQLLGLLLAFGVIPLAVTVVVGYRATRTAMIARARDALVELTHRQAGFLDTEIGRERLLLRTITGQLEAAAARLEPNELSGLLVSSLADDGVFDGLRLMRSTGEIVSEVALRPTLPDWPDRMDAGRHGFAPDGLFVHREGTDVKAYVLTTPVHMGSETWWLEGHVPEADFARLLDLPEHALGGLESALFDRAGNIIAAPHEHAVAELRPLFASAVPDTLSVSTTVIDGRESLVVTKPLEVADWVFTGSLALEVVLAPVARLRKAALLGSALLIVLIVGAAHVAARSVTTPLRELAAAAGELGRTGDHTPIHHGGVAETEELVNAFNEMATSLRESRAQIEQLHTQEMERAQQLATVGELASGVAHEVRNPLTGVLGALEVAAGRLPERDSALPLLAEARRQLQRMEATTTRLLEFARPPTMRQLDVDIHTIVERALNVVEPQARAAGLEIKVEGAAPGIMVRADPELLVQVMVNLCLNSIEASPSGGRISLAVIRRRSCVAVEVRDSGTGIPPDQRSSVFRPFFTTKPTGTGLGLSISHQIVTRHGGSLALCETPGGGATFVVELPLLDPPEVAS